MYGGSVCKGGLGLNPGCSRTKQLGQDSVGEVRREVGIRGRVHSKKINSQQERGSQPDWQSVMVNGTEPAQELNKKVGKLE